MPQQPTKPSLEPPLAREDGWTTIEAPELVSFEKLGDTISGVLLSITHVEVSGKRVIQYTLGRDSKRLKLLATYDLAQKIGRSMIGQGIRIKYRGEDPSISKNGNAMKVFDVQTKAQAGAAASSSQFADGSPITDEDIPF